ncbi:MAG: putative transcriptional regulator [Ilumatobacteraceae bacterium]|nr:putative transcriptional regulator [Ilumatobacteraceae bacterium]
MAKPHLLDLREVLGDFVAAQPVGARVRPEIAASWRRSLSADLQPSRFDVPYEPAAGDAERLGQAARPILEQLVGDFSSTSMCLVLTDTHGRIVERRVGERSLRSRLDAIMLAPGFRYEEDHVGTNAIGTTLEQHAPSFVVGGEHFADALTGMACAAAPILDPTTDAVLGAIDLTCPVEQSHSLMLAVAKHAARDIERELAGNEPPADRALLERFLRARLGARGPMAALNERVMYTNAPALKLLETTDRTLLWSVVSAAIVDRPGVPIELPLASGWIGTMSTEPILDGRALVGALLRFRSLPAAQPGEVRAILATDRRPTFGWGSLTQTEASVTELVSDGLTNREVAARMFLSAHTVGFHLRQIFRKLDINSRVELTRHFVERSGDLASPTAG